MRKFLAVLSIVAVFCLFSTVRAGTSCTASATCSNDCDTVSFSVSGDSGCKCKCDGQHVHCEYTVVETDPDTGSHGEDNKWRNSRDLKDCTQGGGEGGGTGTGENSNDLGWCTQCYDSNGNLTPLGEFFANIG